jgi:hypothetical protein
MDKLVKYGRIGQVVILIFPDEAGSKQYISQIETQKLLKKIGMEKVAVPPITKPLQPRVIA